MDDETSRRVPSPSNEECNIGLLKLPRNYSHWEERLRTPVKNIKQKSVIYEIDANSSGMTKNCEQLFSQMMSTHGPVKTEQEIDPSFSVRRIIKGSGLLKTFGTGYLEKEEAQESLWNETEHRSSEDEENSKSPISSDDHFTQQQVGEIQKDVPTYTLFG